MKQKMTKDIIPDDFSISLALVDFIPVLFFSLSLIKISSFFANVLFLFGALLCLFAGLCKVLWKIIVVIRKKNIWWMFLQMRISMPIGMLLMVFSLIPEFGNLSVLSALFHFPSHLFFIIGIFLMIAMIIFAFTLDGSKQKNNWIEQIVNSFAQFSFFIALLLIG